MQALQNQLNDLLVVVDLQDIYYLTWMRVSRGLLLVHKTDARLFVDKRYIEKASMQLSVKAELVTKENITAFLQSIDYDVVLTEFEAISYQKFQELKSDFFSQKKVQNTKCIKEMRFVKTSDEIALMQKSAALNKEGLEFAKSILRAGITEKEVAWEFEKFCREKGASKLAFDTIVAFGSNTSMPHYRPGERKLKENDPVLIDCGIVLDEYCSDLTRSFVYKGKNPEYEALGRIVLEAYERVLTKLKIGTSIRELDQSVRAFFEEKEKKAKFQHNLGHSVGLDVHEYPVLSSELDPSVVLKEGAVLAIEPGLYEANRFGFRHENVVCITKEGYKIL